MNPDRPFVTFPCSLSQYLVITSPPVASAYRRNNSWNATRSRAKTIANRRLTISPLSDILEKSRDSASSSSSPSSLEAGRRHEINFRPASAFAYASTRNARDRRLVVSFRTLAIDKQFPRCDFVLLARGANVITVNCNCHSAVQHIENFIVTGSIPRPAYSRCPHRPHVVDICVTMCTYLHAYIRASIHASSCRHVPYVCIYANATTCLIGRKTSRKRRVLI